MRLNALLALAVLLFAACARQVQAPPGSDAISLAGNTPSIAEATPVQDALVPSATAVLAPDTPAPPPTSAAVSATTASVEEIALTTPVATVAGSEPALPSPTADPFAGLTIEGLAAREYGDGSLQIVETIHVTESFTRTLVSYASDGLTVYGFMNVPFGAGPFPVALVLHGYIPPRQYGTIGYTTRYADILARNRYLVIHPNYRNHPPSDETEAFAAGRQETDFRVGYAIDVLNLLAIVQEQGGLEGPLAQADPSQLHLLGHSMGGGIALRVITVNPDVDGAVLYGSMSGDEVKNFERIQVWSNGEAGREELATAAEDLQRISPIFHLSRINAAVSIHHGDLDDVVPPEWSEELCQLLQEHGKEVECFNYPGAPHSFHDDVDQLFQQRVIDFFNRY